MFMQIIVVLAILAVAMAEVPKGTQFTASVKDTNVNGLEGLNVNIVAPFKVQDAVVGFRYALGSLRKLPESLFAHKTVSIADGELKVDADFTTSDNNLGIVAKWTSGKAGLALGASADLKDHLKSVSFEKDVDVQDKTLKISGDYDMHSKKFSTKATVDSDIARIALDYDTETKNPRLEVTKDLDSSNSFSPSISLKTGDLTYGYKRTWKGGALSSRLHPGDKISVEWTDDGTHGSWKTTADVPLDNTANTKVSFTRNWDY